MSDGKSLYRQNKVPQQKWDVRGRLLSGTSSADIQKKLESIYKTDE